MVLVAWIRELEYLRGFAALAVIAVHVSMNFTQIPAVNLPGLLNVFIYITAHFAVPVFIFISGWVLALRYSGAYSIPAYYRRRARTILPPYLFFTGLYLLIPVEGAIRVASLPDPGAVVGALLMGTAAYHLWFFVVIIQLYLLYPLIVRGYDVFDRIGAAVRSLSPAWVIVAAALGALLVGGVWVVPMLLHGSFSGATLAVFCVYRIIEPLYYIPVIVLLFMAATWLEKTGGILADSFRSFGEHSFGIYLIHPAVIAVLAATWASWTGLSWTDWMTYPVLFVATTAVGYGVVRGVSVIPATGWLVGESRSRRGRPDDLQHPPRE